MALALLTSPAAQAHQPATVAPSKGAMPSAVPSAITPNVDDTDGAVWSVAQVGNTLVMGGKFTSVAGQSHVNLAAFNATTGALSSTFTASTNGQVYSVLPGTNDHTVFVGGSFTQVNGAPAQFLSLLDTGTGQVVSSFKAPTFDYGMIRDMVKVGDRLIVGGFFSKVGGKAHAGLASLNTTTGAVDSFLSVQLAGHHNDTGSGAQGYIGPWALDASPDGKRLAVIGNFKTANGLPRDQVAMVDIDGASAVVDPDWATTRYTPYCFNWAFDSYVRGVSFSPDSSYLVINATGGGVQDSLCDATARFETASTGTNIQPTWVDETGGDTVWGVTITDTAVFIGGHNRWNNNPLGSDRAQPGAVPRPGMAALDPVSGRPFTWNPGHNPLGDAVYAYLATDKGLWMGYDSNWIGNTKYRRQKIAFFPYDGGSTVASTSLGRLPGTVYLGNYSSNGQSNVLYRVDAGGPEVSASDGGPDWAGDTAPSPSPYHNSQSNAADYAPVANVTSAVPASTPSSIFDHERWSPTDSPPMNWDFPVAAGTHATVRLYFANRCTCTGQAGQRKFDVAINGASVLSSYDIVADAGDQIGTMKSFPVTVPSSGNIDISFTHAVENPLVNGIEIVNNDLPPAPAPTDNLAAVSFDGSTASAPQPVAGSSIPWGQTRGAFVVGDQLFYGSSDGFLYSAPVSGSSIGAATKVDPYHDPVWDGVDTHDGTTFDGNSPTLYSQLPSVTGMFYQAGKLYFTMAGSSTLYSAWFSPDSGIVDNTETAVSSSVDFSNAGGMFVSGSSLYFVKKTDKGLYRVDFTGGVVSGSATLVNGPSTGGVDWTNKSMFFLAAPAANQPPTAGFTSSCTAGGCAFDASTSKDTDGSITDYSWNFGDGSTAGSGLTPSHNYASAGTYSVKLTVTDNSGATASSTQQVTVAATTTQITFVGASHSDAGASKSQSVTVPSGTKVGDTMLLVFTQSSAMSWSTPPSGWTQLKTLTNATINSTAWVKTATQSDLGSTLTLTNSTFTKAELGLAVYSGAKSASPVDVSAVVGDSGGVSHTTPTVNVSSGDLAVSFWTDKSAAVSAWTAPAGVRQRDTSVGTGTSGRYSLLVADSAGPVSAGPYGGLTATTDTASDKALMWTIALTPGSGAAANQQPTAAFTSSCTSGDCSFDAAGSSDPDGTIASYAWDFGDSGVGTGRAPAHRYTASGTYAVKLTVTDDQGATASVTRQVAVTVAQSTTAIGFLGASHSDPGATKTKTVTVPSTAHAGDTGVLVFTQTAGATWDGPGSGWTQVGTPLTNSTITSTAWVKTLAAADVGSTVTMTSPTYTKAVLVLGVYSGVSTTSPIDTFARVGDAGLTAHKTPTVTAAAGDWLVSLWTDKSPDVSQWTAPSGAVQRDTAIDTGTSGRYSELLADSNGPAPAGQAGGLTATTDTTSGRAIMWSFALKPAS